MPGPIRAISHHARRPLSDGWSLACASPAAEGQALPPTTGNWTPIPHLLPVAAALRELGQWSLQAPVRHFDAQDWWYRLHFDADPTAADAHSVLGLDGLATLAEVWLNGHCLLRSDNMFMAHTCDVDTLLQSSGNELLLRFAALDRQLAVRRKRPRWRVPMTAHAQLRWFRTTLLGRTPGWSPPAAVVGPWRDIWLERRRVIDVQELSLQASVQGSSGVLHCTVRLTTPGLPPDQSTVSIASVTLRLRRAGVLVAQSVLSATDAARQTWDGQLRLDPVTLWWPHTHGEPTLYAADLDIHASGDDTVAIDLGRVGFRTLTLDTRNDGFALCVNGVPVFCRGACWTPLDPVTLRAEAPACRAALAQVRAAGMNMLRVMGTAVYEDAAFFDACDEYGVLVWQDLMFANMDYPFEDAAFASLVLAEVRQQLQGWQGRPSLALVCGNSEVAQQAAMWGATREHWRSPMFEQTLADLCAQWLPTTPYWPSSAYGGAFPHQTSAGTTSYYGVGAYLRGLDDARLSGLRFATECLAFANVPSTAALARLPGGLATRVHHPDWKVRSPRDLGAGWDFDDVRDHYVEQLFDVDPQRLRFGQYERYLTLGRIATGEVMAASFAQWRRPDASCRGALVLFLRDLWAGAGWGLLDETGAPKACFHCLRRVLQPVALLLTDDGSNGLTVHLINERSEACEVELDISAWRQDAVRVAQASQRLHLPARAALSRPVLALFDYFIDLNHAYRFGPMVCDAVVASLRDLDGTLLGQAFHFPAGLGQPASRDLGLSATAVMLDEASAELTVQTRHLALSVHFDLPGFEPDDEYFHLAPASMQKVRLRSTDRQVLAGSVLAVNALDAVPVLVSSVAPQPAMSGNQS